jgi:hypothetical protein
LLDSNKIVPREKPYTSENDILAAFIHKKQTNTNNEYRCFLTCSEMLQHLNRSASCCSIFTVRSTNSKARSSGPTRRCYSLRCRILNLTRPRDRTLWWWRQRWRSRSSGRRTCLCSMEDKTVTTPSRRC